MCDSAQVRGTLALHTVRPIFPTYPDGLVSICLSVCSAFHLCSSAPVKVSFHSASRLERIVFSRHVLAIFARASHNISIVQLKVALSRAHISKPKTKESQRTEAEQFERQPALYIRQRTAEATEKSKEWKLFPLYRWHG